MSTSTNPFGDMVSFPIQTPRGDKFAFPNLEERRSKSRYSLDLGIRFRTVGGRPLFSGAGHTINISSGGVLLVSKDVMSKNDMRVGSCVEMRINWPLLLDDRVPLQLLGVGRVLRRGESHFAATFERYEFRTLKSKSLSVASSEGDVLEWPS
jgi:hypothetical protein